MIEWKTLPAPVQQQDNLLLTMADLRKKRIELNMASTTAAQYLGVDYGVLCRYERRNDAPYSFINSYNEYLKNCENGLILYKKGKQGKNGVGSNGRLLIHNAVSYEKVKRISKIRKSMKIFCKHAASVINISSTSYSDKERGQTGMSQTEYTVLMKFYRQEKLKRIFGSHYKEGMMS